MKHWATAMGTLGVILMGMLAGCEKRAPHETSEYDPAVDALPTNLVADPDPALAEDQEELARRTVVSAAGTSGAARAKTTTAPAAGAAGGPEVAEVKQVMAKVIEAAKAGDPAQLTAFFSPEDGQQLQAMLTAAVELPKKAAALEAAVKETLGVAEVPAALKQATGGEGMKGSPLAGLAEESADALNYQSDGTTVTVIGQNPGEKLKFTKAADGWKITLDANEKKMFGIVGEMMAAQVKLIDTLTAGIKDGTVTQGNLDQKVLELAEALVKPSMQKMMELMADAMKNALTSPTSAPAP